METVSLGDRRKESIKGILEIYGKVEKKLLVVWSLQLLVLQSFFCTPLLKKVTILLVPEEDQTGSTSELHSLALLAALATVSPKAASRGGTGNVILPIYRGEWLSLALIGLLRSATKSDNAQKTHGRA